MNKLISRTIFTLLVITAYMSSFGMMSVYNKKPLKQIQFKDPEKQQQWENARKRGFERFQKYLKDQRSNIKLIEPRQPEYCAMENVSLSTESLIKIGDYGAAKALRPTCRFMSDLFSFVRLNYMRDLCSRNEIGPWIMHHYDVAYDAHNLNLLFAFAFSIALNDTRSVELLSKKLAKLEYYFPSTKCRNYEALLLRLMFNDLEEAFESVVKKDPFNCNNDHFVLSSLSVLSSIARHSIEYQDVPRWKKDKYIAICEKYDFETR